MPGLTIILPTIGRQTLERALATITPLHDEDELLIIADTHQPALVRGVPRMIKNSPARAPQWKLHLFDGGFMHYGCPQRNYGIHIAREGNYLVFQDDTDEFTPGALDAIRLAIRALDYPRPMLFAIDVPGGHLGVTKDLRLGDVDGHQFVVPKLPGKVALWPYERYESDWEFIESTMRMWDDSDLVRVPVTITVCHNKEG